MIPLWLKVSLLTLWAGLVFAPCPIQKDPAFSWYSTLCKRRLTCHAPAVLPPNDVRRTQQRHHPIKPSPLSRLKRAPQKSPKTAAAAPQRCCAPPASATGRASKSPVLQLLFSAKRARRQGLQHATHPCALSPPSPFHLLKPNHPPGSFAAERTHSHSLFVFPPPISCRLLSASLLHCNSSDLRYRFEIPSCSFRPKPLDFASFCALGRHRYAQILGVLFSPRSTGYVTTPLPPQATRTERVHTHNICIYVQYQSIHPIHLRYRRYSDMIL